MEIVYFLLPAALVLAVVALAGFIWAARSGQFDDLETPGIRAVLENEFEDETKPGN